MSSCAGCGQPASGGTTFCTGCGARLREPTQPSELLEPTQTSRQLDPGSPTRSPEPPRLTRPRRKRTRAWILVAGVTLIGAIGGATGAVLAARTPASNHAAPSSFKIAAGAHSLTPSPSRSTAPPTPSTTPSPSPSQSALPSTTPEQVPAEEVAARGLATLLAQSASDRGSIVNAVSDVQDCGPDLAQDPGVFRSAVTSRQQLLTRLGSLTDASALPAGLVQALTNAWQASVQADQDFAAWAQDENSGGCSTDDSSDPNFTAAMGPDHQATTYKMTFVNQWNPIAPQYGLPTYQWPQL